jgi:hypothetical protein
MPRDQATTMVHQDSLTLACHPTPPATSSSLTEERSTLLSTLALTYDDEHVEGDVVLCDYAPPQREYENVGLKGIAAMGRPVILLKQFKAKPKPEYIDLRPRRPPRFRRWREESPVEPHARESRRAGRALPRPHGVRQGICGDDREGLH